MAVGEVELWAHWPQHDPADPEWSCGSGYTVGGRLVLTAAHVVCEGSRVSGTVKVRAAAGAELLAGEVVWHRSDGRLDVALVEVTDGRWRATRRASRVRWGRLVTGQPGTVCEAIGFPEVVASPRLRDSEQATGSISPRSLARTGLLAIGVDAAPTRVRARASPWAGMSGAAVWCEGLLTALVVQDPAGFDSGRLVALPVSAFAGDARFRELISRHTGKPPVMEPVEFQALTPAAVPVDSPAALLRADVAPMPFRDRPELAQLLEWGESEWPVSVRLVHGPGGQGKTRLARALADVLDARGWACVTVTDNAPAEQLSLIAAAVVPTLAIIDYAESRPDQIAALAETLVNPTERVRVLLLARTAAGWRDELTERGEQAGLFARTPAIALRPVEPGTAGRKQAWSQAVTALAAQLGSVEGYGHVDWADVAVRAATRVPRLAGSRYATILGVQIDALATLLREGSPESTRGGDPLDVLLEHERRHWAKAAKATAGMPPLSRDLQRRAVACATLWGADGEAQATEVLAHVAGLTQLRVHELSAVAAWLAAVYRGPQYWTRMQPDRVAEHLVGGVLGSDDPDLLADGVAHASTAQLENALTMLSQASVDHTHIREVLVRAGETGGLAVGLAALAVAPRVERPESMLAVIRVLIEKGDIDTLRVLEARLPRYSTVLTSTAAAISERLVGCLRERAEAAPDAYLPDLALSLNILAIRLGEVGRRSEALAPVQEAADLHRRLAEVAPDAYLPDLALSLNNLANRLGEVGRRSEALAPAQEAADLYRRLAEVAPDAYLPDLALSLNNLANRLAEVGRRSEALAPTHEAVHIRRRLVDIAPDPDLALSLNNLAVRLADVGRRSEALSPAQEAVHIRRRLAEVAPDAYLPDLALSLNNLAVSLVEVGRRSEALVLTQEAVHIRRRLAEVAPDAYLPDLALSLNNLAIQLADVGRRSEALAVAHDTVNILRCLADAAPEPYSDQLNSTVQFMDWLRRDE